jgi:nitroimidazol reductase NimA-like FMN-containing flavoprotein (pyridoxamine 5'-phosphate oxidase superfamily)
MTKTDTSLETLARVLSPKSKWGADATLAFLRENRLPLRVSSIDSGGFPHITSLWFRFSDGRFLCCTQQRAVVCRQLRRNPCAGFEVAVNAPPYYGLSGQGTAKILDDDATELLNGLVEHYLEGRDAPLRAWLLSRIATEVIIEITPQRITSWDFRNRMSRAN